VDIEVRLFANLNKFLPPGSTGRRAQVSMPADSTVAALLEHLSLPASQVHLVAVNGRHQQDLSYVLQDTDQVSIFPPLAGGAARLGPFHIGPEEIDVTALGAAVADPSAGAMVTFVGTVRNRSRGKGVTLLEYEAYVAMAEEVLAQVAGEMAGRWDLCAVAISQRTGRLQVGQASIGIAVSAVHRQAAFAACAYAIDRIKEILPVWKKEFAEDGASWVEGPGQYSGAKTTVI
jgi:molybdopterin synthase catalytic subunit/molybdopterin converting factor small subunit